jgi:hypothetical protein
MAKILNEEFGLPEFHRETHQHFVYEVEKHANEIILHYYDEYYMSVWIGDETTFKAFPGKYLVQAGGWYGDYGRWDTLKRKVRKIKCTVVTELGEEPTNANEATVIFVKSVGVDFVNVQINSPEAGRLHFICKEVCETDFYKLLLFDKTQEEFVDATQLFDDEFTFIGTLQPQNNTGLEASNLANKQAMFLGSDFKEVKDLFETICPLCDGDDFIGCLLPDPENCPDGKGT